jgi:hypothetical protein
VKRALPPSLDHVSGLRVDRTRSTPEIAAIRRIFNPQL